MQQPNPSGTRGASSLPVTDRSTLRRREGRGSHARSVIDAIIDEAPVCHVGVQVDGAVRVLPTAHVRVGDFIYLHGARASSFLGDCPEGRPLASRPRWSMGWCSDAAPSVTP